MTECKFWKTILKLPLEILYFFISNSLLQNRRRISIRSVVQIVDTTKVATRIGNRTTMTMIYQIHNYTDTPKNMRKTKILGREIQNGVDHLRKNLYN